MDGIIYTKDFLSNHRLLFEYLRDNTVWDERMKARKTASFGRAYNYSQIEYPYQEFSPEMVEIIESIEEILAFRPNNCLINYYENGNSMMGFHSDQIDVLQQGTGVVIISLGETRTLRFRNIQDRSNVVDFNLISGSLIYMSNEIQKIWQHAIIRSDTERGRMSLTFRKLK